MASATAAPAGEGGEVSALYMDVHVPAAITRALRRRGADVVAAQDDGAARLLDPALLDRAAKLGCIVFTRDSDFLAEEVLPL